MGWYRKDSNAVPATYILQARRVDTAACCREKERQELRQAERTDWLRCENDMRSVLRAAVQTLGDPDGALFEQSATHQEIAAGALSAAEVEGQVLAYFRTIEAPPPPGCGVEDFIDTDVDDAGALSALRQQIEARLPRKNCHEFAAQWHAAMPRFGVPGLFGQPDGHMEAFCERVECDLKRIITAEITSFQTRPWLKRQRQAHSSFGSERRRFFRGRTQELNTIRTYLADPEACLPLILYGPPGSGKSALLAHAAEEVRRTAPDAQVIVRYVGAERQSSSLRGLLTGVCRELGADEPLEELHELVSCLRRLIGGMEPVNDAERPTVVFIDGLDQLDRPDKGLHLMWCPVTLRRGVHVVLSLQREADPATFERAAMLWPNQLVPLTALSDADGKAMLSDRLQAAGRQLTPEQEQSVLAQFTASGRLPFYLRLAFELVRHWHSWYRPADCGGVLGRSQEELLANMFGRWEAGEHHGRVLVEAVLSYLACSKSGLSEDELWSLLSDSDHVVADYRRRNPDSPPVDYLPPVVLSRLLSDLRPYLMQREVDGVLVWQFFHHQLGEVVVKRYRLYGAPVPTPSWQTAHAALRQHFEAMYRLAPAGAARSARALAYHASRSLQHNSEALEQLLLQPDLIAAWAETGYVHELTDDVGQTGAGALGHFLLAWATEALWLTRFPAAAVQTVHNALHHLPVMADFCRRAEAYLRARASQAVGFCLETAAIDQPRSLSGTYTLSGQLFADPAFDQQRLYYASDGTVVVRHLAEGTTRHTSIPAAGVRLVCGSADGAYVLLVNAFARPLWRVFDRFDSIVCGADSVPAVEGEPRAAAFAANDHAVLVTSRVLAVYSIPFANEQLRFTWPPGEDIVYAALHAEERQTLVTVCVRSSAGCSLHTYQLRAEADAVWSLTKIASQPLTVRPLFLACSSRLAGLVTTDGRVHLLPCSAGLSLSQSTLQLKQGQITAFAVDDEFVYYSLNDSARVFRQPVDGGETVQTDKLGSNIGVISVCAGAVYALLGTMGQALVPIPNCAYAADAGQTTHPTGPFLLPGPVRAVRESLCGSLKLLLYATPTVEVVKDGQSPVWVAASAGSVLDAAAAGDGVYFLLDKYGELFCGRYPDPRPRRMASVPGCTRVLAGENGVVCVRVLQAQSAELLFLDRDGKRVGQWSSLNHANTHFLDADASRTGAWNILVGTGETSDVVEYSLLRLNGSAQEIERRSLPLRALGRAKLQADTLLLWNSREVLPVDLQAPVYGTKPLVEPKLGQIKDAAVTRSAERELLMLHGEYGLLLVEAPAKRFLLPRPLSGQIACLSGRDNLVVRVSSVRRARYTLL